MWNWITKKRHQNEKLLENLRKYDEKEKTKQQESKVLGQKPVKRETNKEKNIIERAAAEENLNTGDLILKAISFYLTFKKVEPTFNDMLEYCQSNPLMLLKLEDFYRFQNMKLRIKEGLNGKGRAIE